MWDRGHPVRLPNDERIFLNGFITDITGRKITEIELAREQAYSRIIRDAAMEAVISVSEKGLIEELNPSARTIFGYHGDAVICRKESQEKLASLTDRERQVFESVTQGKMNKTTGFDLQISERTVEVHRSQVMKKLGVKTLAQLVRIKIESELVAENG